GAPELADGCTEWITSIPLRGYRFNGQVTQESAAADAPMATSTTTALASADLPVRLTRLVGREADVLRIHAALDSHRLVTLVGTGGIGKTSAAIEAARELAQPGTPVA